jgi:orotate phosphoribosyltransferase
MNKEIMNHNKEWLLKLLKQYSYKESDYFFTLASGKKSKYFIDCKQTLLQGKASLLAGEIILFDIIHFLLKDGMKINAVAGVALGGCSLATSVSLLSSMNPEDNLSFNRIIAEIGSLNSIYIRKEVKDHGTKNLIEGYIEPNSNIVLLEDTITTGGSSINALNVLKNVGHNPVAVISIVDRLEGGPEAITEKFGIPVISVYSIKDFQ